MHLNIYVYILFLSFFNHFSVKSKYLYLPGMLNQAYSKKPASDSLPVLQAQHRTDYKKSACKELPKQHKVPHVVGTVITFDSVHYAENGIINYA